MHSCGLFVSSETVHGSCDRAAVCFKLSLELVLLNRIYSQIQSMNGSNMFPQVVPSTRSVSAERTKMGFLPSVSLEMMAQMLAAISTMEALTAYWTHQWRDCVLERKYSHPSGYLLHFIIKFAKIPSTVAVMEHLLTTGFQQP